MKVRQSIQAISLICLLVSCENKKTDTLTVQPEIKEIKEIYGEWILTNNLDEDTLIFKKQSVLNSNDTWLKQFSFQSDQLNFSYLKKVPTCGNGIITIDSSNWKYDENSIEIYLKAQTINEKLIHHVKYQQMKSF